MTLDRYPDCGSELVTTAFDCAVSDVMDAFRHHVLENLNTILSNPSVTATTANAIADPSSVVATSYLMSNFYGSTMLIVKAFSISFPSLLRENMLAQIPSALLGVGNLIMAYSANEKSNRYRSWKVEIVSREHNLSECKLEAIFTWVLFANSALFYCVLCW